MEDCKTFTQANRKAWNEAMPYHRKAKDLEWDKKYADLNIFSRLNRNLGC